MRDSEQDLTSLWQAQPVNSIDLEAVKKTFKKEKKNQRLYIVIDCLAFLPVMLIMSKHWSDLSILVQSMLVGIILLMVPFLGYQLWLRRIAAFSRTDQTLSYLNQLINQIKNNIRIAWMTKHSTWLSVSMIAIFYVVLYLLDELASDEYYKGFLATAIVSILMLPWYIWADKRQKRFESELTRLIDIKKQLDG